ncbi:MAG: hypothetical protein VB110_03435 [Bacteroidales bacterium]|nr:hypothetical protein [Bacteroidales bacterium]
MFGIVGDSRFLNVGYSRRFLYGSYLEQGEDTCQWTDRLSENWQA